MSIMTQVRRYFVSGLLVWVPIWVTILAIDFLVNLLSKSLTLLPAKYQPDVLLGFHVPGIGVVITVCVILFTGMFAANYIGGQLVEWGDAIVARIPLVRAIYSSVKQVMLTLFTPGGQSFRKVLLVQYPHAASWSIAFQTGEVGKDVKGALHDEAMVSYFIPTTPNPTSGFLMMAPKSQVIELNMSVDQALKYVISLGVVQPVMSSAPKPKTN